MEQEAEVEADVMIQKIRLSEHDEQKTIQYFVQLNVEKGFSILRSDAQIQTLCLLKHFTEQTLLELGQDWRIQSGLLTQEINIERQKRVINVDKGQDFQFCIFNQFMVSYLKGRIGAHIGSKKSEEKKCCKMNPETEENIFSSNLDQIIGQIIYNGQKQEHPISQTNIAFNTLSLGFCITARDNWQKTFGGICPFIQNQASSIQSKEQIMEEIRMKENKEVKIQYLASLRSENTRQAYWIIQTEKQFCLNNQKKLAYQKKTKFIQSKLEQQQSSVFLNSNFLIMGGIIIDQNINQFIFTQKSTQNLQQHKKTTFRVFSLSQSFYYKAFVIWMIFSIKKQFTNLSQEDFQRYFMYTMVSSSGQEQNRSIQQLKEPLRQFQRICTQEWKLLMKDCNMVLNHDIEVLRTLVGRISQKILKSLLIGRFKENIQQKNGKLIVQIK